MQARVDGVATGVRRTPTTGSASAASRSPRPTAAAASALAVMAALVEWGAAQGATTAYLQVLGDNEPARRLYEGLGFATHHRYCYLTPAADRRAPDSSDRVTQ